MALHFTLMVNDMQIGRFAAVRREKNIPIDRICTYDVEVALNGIVKVAVVRHNYDAGALELIQAAIAETMTSEIFKSDDL